MKRLLVTLALGTAAFVAAPLTHAADHLLVEAESFAQTPAAGRSTRSSSISWVRPTHCARPRPTGEGCDDDGDLSLDGHVSCVGADQGLGRRMESPGRARQVSGHVQRSGPRRDVRHEERPVVLAGRRHRDRREKREHPRAARPHGLRRTVRCDLLHERSRRDAAQRQRPRSPRGARPPSVSPPRRRTWASSISS